MHMLLGFEICQQLIFPCFYQVIAHFNNKFAISIRLMISSLYVQLHGALHAIHLYETEPD